MNKRLRIAVLSRNFSTTGGGAERYSVAMVEHIAANHEVHVYAQTIGHDFPGVNYHHIPMPMARPRWINQLYFAWETWRATKSGFDIVHSHENSWYGNVQTVHVLPIKFTLFNGKYGFALALRWLRVLTSPRLLAYLWLEQSRYASKSRRRIVLASEALKIVMLAQYPHIKSAMEVIAPGVAHAPGRSRPDERHSARVALALPVAGRGLLFVGNDFRKKGLPTLLDTLALLPNDVWLAVVGDGSQAMAMREHSKRLGLEERTHFLSAMQDVDVAYRAADVLVHPTLEDTYAMVVLEAMAHGLPVVVSGPKYCGIAKDLIHESHALLLEDPSSVPSLAAEINRVLSDVELAGRLSTNATEFARNRSWQAAAEAYDVLYQGLSPDYRQRWLVLSHAFNMDGRAASQTITDKLPHLERAGIELVVLSGVSGRKDSHFEHHQLWPAGPAGIRFEMRHVLRRHFGDTLAYRFVMVGLSLPLLPLMLLEKLLRPVESSWSWWLSAYVRGASLFRKRKFDLIYSTGGAFAAHAAAKQLKEKFNLPWLAEVHDPLVTPWREGALNLTVQEKMQFEIEKLICTHTDIAVWFTDQALASALRRHPQLGGRGKMMIPGIDNPFKLLPAYQPGPKFVLGHFGSLSVTRNLKLVIAALEHLQTHRPDLVAATELHVYGGPLDSISSELIAHSPVGSCVRHFGRIEVDSQTGLSGREQILRRMRTSDVLLLLHGDEAICSEYIPSKLYEYLWMQRPILAVVHSNPQMAALVRGQGHRVVSTGNGTDRPHILSELVSALTVLFDQWRNDGLNDNSQDSPYTTERSAMHLISWTNELLKAKQ